MTDDRIIDAGDVEALTRAFARNRGQEADPLSPISLGERGQALYDELSAHRQLDAGGRVLLVEAARTADRLEHLHLLLSGDDGEWARLKPEKHFGEETGDLIVHVDAAMTEVRQQVATLRLVLGQLDKAAPPVAAAEKEVDVADDLAAAREARRVAAAAAAPPA